MGLFPLMFSNGGRILHTLARTRNHFIYGETKWKQQEHPIVLMTPQSGILFLVVRDRAFLLSSTLFLLLLIKVPRTTVSS